MTAARSAMVRRIAARRHLQVAPSLGVRPETVEIFTRFVRLNPSVPANSPVLPRVWRAYDVLIDGGSDA